jgi:PleD family two-component response regulator
MSQPLALVLYENIMPGSRLVNMLQDLGYRVVSLHEPSLLVTRAQQEKPLVVLAELGSTGGNVCAAIAKLRKDAATKHLPVIAFGDDTNANLHDTARTAGATLVVSKSGLLEQLEVLLDQALDVH